MALYESIFIVNPNADETTLQEIIQSVHSFIESNGGDVKHTDVWGRKRLAYEVKHFREGYFVLVIFEAVATVITELCRQYSITDGIIKSMVVRFEGDLTKAMEPRGSSTTELDSEVGKPVEDDLDADSSPRAVTIADSDDAVDDDSSEEE